MGFSDKVQAEALAACERRCCICHNFCGTKMTLHHIVQRADGGDDSFDNCIPLCLNCHEDMGTAGWLLEQFKYFLKACGYANETVDKLIFLGYGEKVINANGEVIYEYK